MTKDQKLAILRAEWQRSNDRIIDLSYLGGRDHTVVAQLLALEFKARRLLAEQIQMLST